MLLDYDVVPGQIRFPSFGRLGQCWLEMQSHSNAVGYLLLLGRSSSPIQDVASLHLPIDTRPVTETRSQLRMTIASYLENEVERIQASWQVATTISTRTHRNDTILMMLSYCIFGTGLKKGLALMDAKKSERCIQPLLDMIRDILSYVFGAGGDQALREGAVQVLVAVLPDLKDISPSAAIIPDTDDYSVVLDLYLGHIRNLDSPRQSLVNASEDVNDDIFEDDSQRSRHDEDLCGEVPRLYYEALSSTNSAYVSSLFYVILQHSLVQEGQDSSRAKLLPSSFITHLTSLPPHRLLSCWPLLIKLTRTGWQPRPEDTEGLLNHIAACFMIEGADDSAKTSSDLTQRPDSRDSIYNWDRCESAIGLGLCILNSSISSWTDYNCSGSSIGESIYSWLLDLNTGQNQVSDMIKVQFVGLLYRMWEGSPDYAMNIPDLPSVRTTLLNLLKDGTAIVKFRVAEKLSSIFLPFAAGDHEAIMNDVQAVLPQDPGWREGITIRLLIFESLGSEWKSLLRRCFYGVVETAAHVPAAIPQAKGSLRRMAQALNLLEPRDLLQLFKSQLLFTWLDTHNIDMLPYAVFDFSCIDELLDELKSDIVSIMFMRGSQQSADQKLKMFLSLTSSTLEAAVRRSFARVTAYSLVQDITAPKNPDGTANNDAEIRVQSVLKLENYAHMLLKNHHFVLGHVFMRLDREENIAKALEKRMMFAQTALKEMVALSSSPEELPSPQQPSLKAKFLPALIERLQSRLAKQSSNSIWSPQQVCAISRMLLNDINPVFGTSHTVRVVRRIRLLVALCGDVVLKGYPLEQLLHGLRPLVTISGHNQDAIGVYQYLLDKGRPYLESRPAFLTGIVTALFLELLKHGLSGNSDIEMSEGIRRSRSLHQWLARYLDIYRPAS